jgi:hypothetical protein
VTELILPARCPSSSSTEAQVTGPDENIAAALRAFAEQLREAAETNALEPNSIRKSKARPEQLRAIAKEIDTLAERSQSASYQAFARLLDKARQAGATIASETVFAVGRAFAGHSYVRPDLPVSPSGGPMKRRS